MHRSGLHLMEACYVGPSLSWSVLGSLPTCCQSGSFVLRCWTIDPEHLWQHLIESMARHVQTMLLLSAAEEYMFYCEHVFFLHFLAGW